ncbi:type VII secretion protein EccCa [Mycolicibacterium wolinskyi]|uniref:type VII secretion protein EccCa n=1 Tax=Mycolicibacterium wolinskyi TaxID=59750 RepID=UPI0039176D3E
MEHPVALQTSGGPPAELVIDAPPPVPKATPVNPVARLLPVVLVIAMVGMMAVYFGSGPAAARGPAFMFFPVMMVMSVLGTLVYSLRGNGRAAELTRDRSEYLRYLDGLDAVAAATAQAQWETLHGEHPAPATLWLLVGTDRMWVRAPDDRGFGDVRIGIGVRPLLTRLVAPAAGPAEDRDPVTAAALDDLMRNRSVVADVPVTVNICSRAHLAVGGPSDDAGALVRAMLCQLAVAHSPRHLRIAAVLGPSAAEQWDWLKWLPHHWHPRSRAGQRLLRYQTVAQALDDDAAMHVVVIADGVASEPSISKPGVTVLTIGCASDTSPDLAVGPDKVSFGDALAQPDRLTVEQALTCARRLARYRSAKSPTAERSTWLRLIGLGDPARFDPVTCWRTPDAQNLLRVPIGLAGNNAPVHLDLKEAAHNGMGPHGLCVGATGSGKSEFLKTLVLGLAVTHPPEALNLVLVDFKGGATFLGLESVPHVSALITNLADEAPLVARMADALAGELNRRQELLRAAGNLADITDYRHKRPDLPALPALLIVVDEFSELLHQHPDFADLFVAIGRLGRSLGMHLLLASQRLDEGRLRGLESHLSYRVCLKTFSPNESRAVLGVPDAYQLPNAPGAAYLKTPSGELTRFQTAFVSGGYDADAPVVAAPQRVRPFVARCVVPDRQAARKPRTTVLDAVLAKLVGHGTPAHRVWLPPLPDAVPLSDVLMPARQHLTVAIGLVDRPFEQRRDRLVVRLDGAAGNVAIVGGPQSGKSTAAKTLALALAATHHPSDVQLYGFDFGGGALSALRALPHVGAIAGRHDVDLVRRTVTELEGLVRGREKRFASLGIDSMAEYRRRRDERSCDDPFGDVFLIVDGWSTLRGEFEHLEPVITALAVRGLSFGVHVVASASRWAEFRPALKDQLGTRIELRLGDPAESEMDRKRARELGPCPPGRGLTRDGRELLIALPRLDGAPSDHGIGAALVRTGDTLRSEHRGARAPEIRLLPALVEHHTLRPPTGMRPATQVVLGLGELELSPVVLDFAEQPDLLILGDTGCGKSTALRTMCRALVDANAPDAVRLLIVDFRRTLLGVVESEHLAGYAVSAGALETALAELTVTLRARMPGPDVDQRALRDRSWWAGPELYIVIDDYDLVAGSGANPLALLLEFLPQARDIGLHLIVARRSGGAARAMFDPVLARLRELGCMGLLMSASPEEGVLLGSVRPAPLPPGRGTLITRAAADQLIQVAVIPEDGQ